MKDMAEKFNGINYPTIAPSVLSADFSAMGKDVRSAAESGAKILHLDVMDGHFVPNITFGPQLVKSIREIGSDLFFDVHLMMTNPLTLIENFISAGADAVTVHCECCDDIELCLDKINSCGKIAGLSIKPNTPADAVFPYLEKIGLVLIMTVEPGFGGQSMIFSCLEKIAAIKAEAERRGLPVPKFSVDGGVNNSTCAQTAAAGADILVAGSAFYGAENRSERFAELETAAKNAREQ